MFRRQRNSPGSSPDSQGASASSLRYAIFDAIWAVRDRVAVRLGPPLRAVADVVKWPFERTAFAIQRGLLWPLEDRAQAAGRPARALAFGAVVLLAAGAGVAALIWAAPDGPHSPTVSQAATQTSRPLATAKAAAKAPAGPTLHGAAPVFKPAATGGASEVDSAKPIETAPAESSSSSSSASSASSTGASTSSAKASTAAGPPAGPAAISVARDFAGAFVLYETGSSDSGVGRAFGASATPELSRSLMRRPPRLPANVTVPRAKVVNVVAAPSHGRVYPVSVSLLRVGVTSELRLEMEQLGKEWRVTNVLG